MARLLTRDSAQEGAQPEAKRVVDLLEREFSPIPCYIEPEILPKNGTLLFGGEAKIGKSFMMGELVRGLVTCQNPFDYEEFVVPRQVRVLACEQELGERGFKKRMQKLLEKDSKRVWEDFLWYESKNPLLQLDTAAGEQYFRDMIRDVRPQVLVLDPIAMFHTSDENSAEAISKLFIVVEKLKKVGEGDEMSIMFSHHFGKPPRGQDGRVPDGFDRLSPYNFRGTSKWKDAPDTICTNWRAKELEREWAAWELHTRWLTRHESPPPDMVLTVNEKGDDARVRWKRNLGGGVRLLKEGPHKEIKAVGKEVDFIQSKLLFPPLVG